VVTVFEHPTAEGSEHALRQLERELARLPCGLIGRLAAVWRERPRSTYAGRPVDLTRVGLAAEQLVEGLRFALEHGALESVETLLQRLQALEYEPDDSFAVSLVEALLVVGDRDGARVLAARRRSSLLRSSKGVALLELLGDACPVRLADGRTNLLGLSLRASEGRLNVSQLTGLVAGDAWQWLRQPDLQLLFFSALWPEQPMRAIQFLNRFLWLCGTSGALTVVPVPGASVLAQLRGCASAPARGPLVSVVIAAHNAQETLAFAVESLLAQNYRPLELLIGDDASSDDTVRVMERFAKLPNVRCFRSARNQGAYNLRNALALEASGSLLTFHDADDFALPTRLQSQVRPLIRSGYCGSVSSLLRVRPNGEVVFFKNQKATRLSRVSLLLSRNVFRSVGMFRSARIGADEELQARVREHFGAKAIRRIAAPLTLCSWTQQSATRGLGSEALEDGYRSPARRAYSELVFRRYRGGVALSDDAINDRLRETGNYAEPCEIVEV
jgi:hypothetical protein